MTQLAIATDCPRFLATTTGRAESAGTRFQLFDAPELAGAVEPAKMSHRSVRNRMDNNVRRIGVLAPPGNVAMERELPRYVPEGIIVNHNRMSRPGSGITRESLLAMIDSVDRAAHDLAQAYPEVILYGCTSGSFLAGPGREDELGTRITSATGIPAYTTSTAVIMALSAIGAKRVFMITPYPDDVNRHELEFLSHRGMTVHGWDAFRCPTSEDIRKLSS